MTGVGHGLTGLSIGVLAMPRVWSPRRKGLLLAAYVMLANLPDLPLPGWGHDRYEVSHSLFVNLLLILAAAGLLLRGERGREALGGWAVVSAGALAWLSHLLLDSFYNHRLGVAIFWPLSSASLRLPLPWFSVAAGWQRQPSMLWRIFAIETAFYGALLLSCVVGRWAWLRPSRVDAAAQSD